MFPKHMSLPLEHNPHKGYYQTVSQYFEEMYQYSESDWVNEEQRIKAFETDEFWALQWYPRTPVGFNLLYAADLGVLLEAAAYYGLEDSQQ